MDMKKAFKIFSIMFVIGAFALWDSWCSKSVRFRRSHTTLK